MSEERNWGIMREMRGRRVGRQAQIMPTLHSMEDQEAAPTLSSFAFQRVVSLGLFGLLDMKRVREGSGVLTGWV